MISNTIGYGGVEGNSDLFVRSRFMTEFFICVLIMVIVEIYQDYLGLLRDEKEGETFKHRDTGFVLWFRITLWSVIIYIFYRVLYYFLDLGLAKVVLFWT